MCLSDYRQLAKILGTPPMFIDVLPLIVQPDEVELLLEIAENEPLMDELTGSVGLSRSTVESLVNCLFRKGFLRKKKGKKTCYSMKSFESIISRYLSEGRAGFFGKYGAALADYRMDQHVKRSKNDPYPESKVLPIPEAIIEHVSIVLPYETAIDILEKAKSLSIRDCECRVTYANCEKPLKTCLAINEFSDELVERGVAKEVSLGEAKKILEKANRHGLVHQALYTDWLKGEIFDLCSCCSCCCTYLRTYSDFGVKHHIAKSGLVVKVDSDKCSGCGTCLDRCVFKARKLVSEKTVVIEENCFGCGLCITTCPKEASSLTSATS